jgi:hypothetical protein
VVGWEPSDIYFSAIDTFLDLCVLDVVRKSWKLNPHGDFESLISVLVEGR